MYLFEMLIGEELEGSSRGQISQDGSSGNSCIVTMAIWIMWQRLPGKFGPP